MTQITNRWVRKIRTFFCWIKYQAFDSFGDAVIVTDPQGTILYCNPAMMSLIGTSTSEIIGLKCWEVVHNTDCPAEYPLMKLRISRKRERLVILLDNQRFEVICDPVLRNSKLKAVIHTLVNVTWYADQTETLRKQAARDPLTGLLNRLEMEDSLEREINRAQRKDEPVSVIMLDIDHFKVFNDTYGHLAGDTVLRSLGKFLLSFSRRYDISFRFGGEELLIVLPGTSLEVAHRRAEEMRKEIKKLEIRDNGNVLHSVEVSLGVASYPNHGSSPEELIRAADTALYRAKQEGRNRVVMAGKAAPETGVN